MLSVSSFECWLEHTKILTILANNNICNYFQYVDDILLVYDTTITDVTAVLNQFNSITTNLQFTIKHETDRQINFLDVTIHRRDKFEFDIYQKPTIRDHIIPKASCHPSEHKFSAICFLTNRMEKYPISASKKKKEYNTIQHILQLTNMTIPSFISKQAILRTSTKEQINMRRKNRPSSLT
jgi:hypothetical protein